MMKQNGINYLLLGIGLFLTFISHDTHMRLGLDFGLEHSIHRLIGVMLIGYSALKIMD